jgi:hypothetical protein
LGAREVIIYSVIGVVLLTTGVVIGVLVMLRLGSDDEELSGGLTASTPKSRRARAARRVFGLYIRTYKDPERDHQDAEDRPVS